LFFLLAHTIHNRRMRIALGIEYRGTAYCGWQSQPSGCGVQDAVERAIATFLGASTPVVCAGRTDTGVHATGQVIHLDTDIERTAQAWVRGVNTALPADIRIVWSHRMADQHAQIFHARFAASARSYRYVLLNDPVAPALDNDRVAWFHAPLDVATMAIAASVLEGEQDFSAFRSSECQAKSPMKTMYGIRIQRCEQLVIFDFRANAFLHHMVRNLVGSLVYVGAGRQDATWLRDVLASRNRALAAPTFSAAGLYLSAIEYDAKFGLPMQPKRALQSFLSL
jgi:tRNA pseudouridine38-40 synthase